MTGERDQRGEPSGEPHEPSPLPPELAEFLRDKDVACLMQGTDQETVFVIKLPTQDIESARGRVPIHLRHELYAHPNAPVIRTTLRVYDQPEAPSLPSAGPWPLKRVCPSHPQRMRHRALRARPPCQPQRSTNSRVVRRSAASAADRRPTLHKTPR